MQIFIDDGLVQPFGSGTPTTDMAQTVIQVGSVILIDEFSGSATSSHGDDSDFDNSPLSGSQGYIGMDYSGGHTTVPGYAYVGAD